MYLRYPNHEQLARKIAIIDKKENPSIYYKVFLSLLGSIIDIFQFLKLFLTRQQNKINILMNVGNLVKQVDIVQKYKYNVNSYPRFSLFLKRPGI